MRRTPRHVFAPATVAALILTAPLAVPAAARAQNQTLDEGTFRIMVAGHEVGRETFSIRESGAGSDAVVVAQGRVTLDNRTVNSSLELTGAKLRPAVYQVQIEGDGEKRIAGRLAGGRFSAKIVSPSGEQMREYLAGDGAVVVDEGVAHQYYFVARAAAAGATTLPLLVPSENRQVMAQLSSAGQESVEVGGKRVPARHLVVTLRGGDARDVWVDDQGRILRVEIPARQYAAVRTSAP